MKQLFLAFAILFIAGISPAAEAQKAGPLKIILIRHGEKEDAGDNLNCQGLNRALQLPKVLIGKFGMPTSIYVPALNAKKSTTHARMFQTASPLAIKYHIAINTKYEVDDFAALAQNVQNRTGTILIVWEHKAMDNLLKALGIKTKGLKWPDNDFDSIWIITYKNGRSVLATDKEGITPAANCSF